MKKIVSMLAATGVLALSMASVTVTTASAASPNYCDKQARQYANQKAGGNALGGAAFGAIGGAVIGGIINGGKGAGTGAIIGGAGGAVVGGSTWQKFYNQKYYQCINSGPAYAPPQPQPIYGVPPVGSNAWKQQCSYKYKSFNWNTGYYLGYDGQYHICQLP
ncbi:MAG TPA: BA14K family protein [Bauldia sp.]|nr:BA14K family protein [Bauldia sp.]